MVKDGAAHPRTACATPRRSPTSSSRARSHPLATRPRSWARRSTRTAFYGVTNDYRDVPREKTFVACRGPHFAPNYDRYEFRIDGIRMPVTAIVPKAAAPVSRGCFRADLVRAKLPLTFGARRQGFHVITGPVPTDTGRPV